MMHREQAILSGKECLDMEALQNAYTQRMGMLHSYINPSVTRNVQSGKRKKKRLDVANTEVRSQVSVPSMPHDMPRDTSKPTIFDPYTDR